MFEEQNSDFIKPRSLLKQENGTYKEKIIFLSIM